MGFFSKLLLFDEIEKKAGFLPAVTATQLLDSAEEMKKYAETISSLPAEECQGRKNSAGRHAFKMGKVITMPEGIYEIGVNIPAGSYILTGIDEEAVVSWYHRDVSGEEKTDITIWSVTAIRPSSA